MPSIWQILVQRRCTDVRSSGQGTKGEDCFANHSDTGSQATAIMPWRPRAGLSNQAVLRYWSQRVESLTGSTSADHQTQKTDRGQVARSEGAPSVSWEFSKTPTFAPNHPSQHQTFSPLIQPKLTIGEVNDPLEHEADHIANKVLRMPAPEFSITAGSPQLSRKCPACEEEQKAQALRTKPAGSAEPDASDAPPIVHEALRSPGQPLGPATRAFSSYALAATSAACASTPTRRPPRRPRRSVRVPIPPARMWSSRAASLRRRRTKDAGSSRMS